MGEGGRTRRERERKEDEVGGDCGMHGEEVRKEEEKEEGSNEE